MSSRVFSLPAPIHEKQEKLSYYPPFSDGKKEEQPKKGRLGEEGREESSGCVCVCRSSVCKSGVCVMCVFGGDICPVLLRKPAESHPRQY